MDGGGCRPRSSDGAAALAERFLSDVGTARYSSMDHKGLARSDQRGPSPDVAATLFSWRPERESDVSLASRQRTDVLNCVRYIIGPAQEDR